MSRFLGRTTVALLVITSIMVSALTGLARDADNDFEATGILNFGNANHQHIPQLSIYVPESDERYVLHGATPFMKPFGGYFPLLGLSISVTGQLVDDGTAIEVSNLHLAEIVPMHHLDLDTIRHWDGEQRYLNALCRFADYEGNTPASPS
jgi:hypothetical protein